MILLLAGCCSSRTVASSRVGAGGLERTSGDDVYRLPAGITPDEVFDSRLLVRFKSGVKSTSALEPYVARGVTFMREIDIEDAFGFSLTAVKVENRDELASAYAELANDPNVECVWPDVIRTPSFVPDDPLYPTGHTQPGQYYLEMVGAEKAWFATTGSESVIVADIDTGTDMDHEDLVNQLWVNSGETPDDGIDNDENDYVDDVHGYDFYSSDGDPEDDEPASGFHGTSTAGIIGAQGNNGLGIMGSAGGNGETGQAGVRLMMLRVGTDHSISLSAEVEAVAYAVLNDAKVINMSFGGESGGSIEQEVMDLSWQAGVVIVAAAGNTGAGAAGGQIDWPAAFDSVIAVGATTPDDNHASFSKTGPEMELVAPGVSLVTTTGENDYTPDVSGDFTGTSAASPVVAGLAALLLSNNPAMSNVQVRNRMQITAVDLGEQGGDFDFGFGRVDFAEALGVNDDQVTVLSYVSEGNLLRWEYGNIGDYDFSGEVGVPDIMEIANNFGALTDDGQGDDALESWIDGDGNGEVGISDITTIANYYLRNVTHYSIVASYSPDGPFSEIAIVDFDDSAGGAPRIYEIEVPSGASRYIAVAPINYKGVPSEMSNVVDTGG
ncbi:S8 family serine peptidase [bacterium]|nr:S8 family serine peptidase [bacterium]